MPVQLKTHTTERGVLGNRKKMAHGLAQPCLSSLNIINSFSGSFASKFNSIRPHINKFPCLHATDRKWMVICSLFAGIWHAHMLSACQARFIFWGTVLVPKTAGYNVLYSHTGHFNYSNFNLFRGHENCFAQAKRSNNRHFASVTFTYEFPQSTTFSYNKQIRCEGNVTRLPTPLFNLVARKKLSNSYAPKQRHWTQSQDQSILLSHLRMWVSASSSCRAAVGQCSFQSERWQYFAHLLAVSTSAGCATRVQLCMLTVSAMTLEQLARITSNFDSTVYPWCIIWYKISTILVISNPLQIPTTMQVHSNMLCPHTSK